MNNIKFETPQIPKVSYENTPLTSDELKYLKSRYEESRRGGEREYFDLFLKAPKEKRFIIGHYFVAIVDDKEIHRLKGINMNVSSGWQSGGLTFILISSRLSSEEVERVLCHEMQEDMESLKHLDQENYGYIKAHEAVIKNPKNRKQILEETEEWKKNRGDNGDKAMAA